MVRGWALGLEEQRAGLVSIHGPALRERGSGVHGCKLRDSHSPLVRRHRLLWQDQLPVSGSLQSTLGTRGPAVFWLLPPRPTLPFQDSEIPAPCSRPLAAAQGRSPSPRAAPRGRLFDKPHISHPEWLHFRGG